MRGNLDAVMWTQRLPFWCAPLVGAAIGAALGLKAGDNLPRAQVCLAASAVGAFGGLAVAVMDVYQRRSQKALPTARRASVARREAAVVTSGPIAFYHKSWVTIALLAIFAPLALLAGALAIAFAAGWIRPGDGSPGWRAAIALGITTAFTGTVALLSLRGCLALRHPFIVLHRDCIFMQTQPIDPARTLMGVFGGPLSILGSYFTAPRSEAVLIAWEDVHDVFVAGNPLARHLVIRVNDGRDFSVNEGAFQMPLEDVAHLVRTTWLNTPLRDRLPMMDPGRGAATGA